MRTTFEPGRFARHCLIVAYDQVLPNSRTPVKLGKGLNMQGCNPTRVPEADDEQSTSRYLWAG